MEGVIYPEIWIAFSKESGIPELKRTTRDEPDYDKLMKWRIGILREHGLKLKDVQNTIAKIRPLPGAKEFLDELRRTTQTVILSDTFSQFAQPLMEQGVLVNDLLVAPPQLVILLLEFFDVGDDVNVVRPVAIHRSRRAARSPCSPT